MMAVGITKVAVICKDGLMLGEWKVNELGRMFEGGDDLVAIEKWEKVKLPEIPTAVRVGRCGVYLGFQSGRISQFVFKTRAWEGSNE